MLKHNTYFEGSVQSIGFERNGARASVGVMAPGRYRFDTAGAERMHVVSGAMQVRIGAREWQHCPSGSAFEIPAKSSFEAETVDGAAAYWCEFL